MKFSVSSPELPGFQITPMLDVVFLLLCFFVTASVFSQWENEIDIHSTKRVVERVDMRTLVGDTDNGARLKAQVADLERLMEAYRLGLIAEKK